jgi:pimeloyl-ACP methyl ester carboxylesterase
MADIKVPGDAVGHGGAGTGRLGGVLRQQWLSLGTDGRGLAYLDSGGDGPVMLALHGTFGRGAIFRRLAADLRGLVRVVAPDQRAHGYSGHGGSVGREEFVGDAAAFVRALGVGPVVVLGHSLGGITGYQLAARHPGLVTALIIEDVGPVMRRPEIAQPVLDVRGWPRSAATRDELERRILAQGVPDAGYFMQSAVPDGGRWRLLFDWDQMMEVQEGGVGDWWDDWLASRCPALVLRGGHSTLLPAELARQMVARRPHTQLAEFPDAGHWIHDDDPAGYAQAVAAFLIAGR